MTTTPVLLPTIKPMLAAPSTGTGSRKAVDLATLLQGTHFFDLKLDGLRAILYWDGSTMRLVNRSGVDITRKFPDVEALSGALPPYPFILDGELVCESGLFNDVATRGKQEKPHAIADAVKRLPARFIAFDLLWIGAEDFRARPFSDRRTLLVNQIGVINEPLLQACMGSDAGQAMWESVVALGLEGLIAKRLDQPYMEGKRSPAWLKYKVTRTLSCIAVGYDLGKGARAHFGAMQLAVIDPNGKPVAIGDVGTGFTEQEIAWLKNELDSGRMPVVEVEALNIGSNGRLRFPVYLGSRQDITHADCTSDQLDQFPRC